MGTIWERAGNALGTRWERAGIISPVFCVSTSIPQLYGIIAASIRISIAPKRPGYPERLSTSFFSVAAPSSVFARKRSQIRIFRNGIPYLSSIRSKNPSSSGVRAPKNAAPKRQPTKIYPKETKSILSTIRFSAASATGFPFRGSCILPAVKQLVQPRVFLPHRKYDYSGMYQLDAHLMGYFFYRRFFSGVIALGVSHKCFG